MLPPATAPAITVNTAAVASTEFLVAQGDNTCTAVLAAGATCTVAITLTPSAVGARTASIDATAAGTTAATTVVLPANGVLPNAVQLVSIGFGGVTTTFGFGNKAVGFRDLGRRRDQKRGGCAADCGADLHPW